MRLPFTRRRRAGDAAAPAAAARAVPAGIDPAEAEARNAKPTARERGAMRRRARQLRRRREAMLLELGGLLYEMDRRHRHEPDLLERKLAEVRAVDEEERALSAALDREQTTVELVTAGVAGPCPSCGLLVGTAARYCERCGTELRTGSPNGAAPERAESGAPGQPDSAAERPERRDRESAESAREAAAPQRPGNAAPQRAGTSATDRGENAPPQATNGRDDPQATRELPAAESADPDAPPARTSTRPS